MLQLTFFWLRLEVGEDAKLKYGEQSQKASREFLIKAIDIANESDLKYKASKNQRLLVELALMKLASITMASEKKKNDSIIPATYFRQRDFEKTKEYSITEEVQSEITKPQEVEVQVPKSDVPSETKPAPKPIVLKNLPHRVSGLSLSSLKAKKEHEAIKNPVPAEEDLPHESFSEQELQVHWNDYIQKLEKKGKKILASNLQADVPKLKDDTTICLEFPNGTMKKEVEREQGPLLLYLKEKLQNHGRDGHGNRKVIPNDERLDGVCVLVRSPHHARFACPEG